MTVYRPAVAGSLSGCFKSQSRKLGIADRISIMAAEKPGDESGAVSELGRSMRGPRRTLLRRIDGWRKIASGPSGTDRHAWRNAVSVRPRSSIIARHWDATSSHWQVAFAATV